MFLQQAKNKLNPTGLTGQPQWSTDIDYTPHLLHNSLPTSWFSRRNSLMRITNLPCSTLPRKSHTPDSKIPQIGRRLWKSSHGKTSSRAMINWNVAETKFNFSQRQDASKNFPNWNIGTWSSSQMQAMPNLNWMISRQGRTKNSIQQFF